MFTGRAVSNVFNGTQQLDSGGKEKITVHVIVCYSNLLGLFGKVALFYCAMFEISVKGLDGPCYYS